MRQTMRTAVVSAVVAVAAVAAFRTVVGQTPAAHTIINASEIKFAPGPEGLPPGAQFAVLEGDPSKAGAPFAIRAKMPDGYRVPPHWHPTDEKIVVLSGTLMLGMGDKVDMKAMKAMHGLTAGGFANMPANARHYAAAKGETIIQVYGTGPFAITYVNPNDDPRKKTRP